MDLVAILNSPKVSERLYSVPPLDTEIHWQLYIISRHITTRLIKVPAKSKISFCKHYINDYLEGLRDAYCDQQPRKSNSALYLRGHETGFILRGAIGSAKKQNDYQKVRSYEEVFNQLQLTLKFIMEALDDSSSDIQL